MNSPPDLGSPAYSTPSSESPPPEEVNFQAHPQGSAGQISSASSHISQLMSHVAATLGGTAAAAMAAAAAGVSGNNAGSGGAGAGAGSAASSVKRRQPHPAHGSSARDAKSRKRGDHGRAGGSGAAGGPGSNWDYGKDGPGGSRKDKDELVDVHVVDKLRRDLGDPFMEVNP
ncbi:hypothetical protein AMATHDRAFT_2783 [Amanita thiersii Skay4041]|uniref:Uncharacterized protein n=1 Tax=Amanita thiersii Skay4041 TaxID=703135 RepID=A0A2A9NTS6_9AGAR|nr:hypothetical protein AMATHDRAFT_2783 [Amanita thiersii Skay4041]